VSADLQRLLMLAFHFPPFKGSSGMQRTLGFCRHLPDFGWQPVVLSAHPRAYPNVAPKGDLQLPAHVHVERAFALDAARHLSILGRYPRVLALPDRWWAWVAGAYWRGMSMIKRLQPAALWSTSPIVSAHLAALLLHRRTGLPWIADLRDPMTEPGYPADPLVYRVHRWVEEQIVKEARRVVLVTPGAERIYRERYPQADASLWACIENGYEEADFTAAGPVPADTRSGNQPVVLLHSGTIYTRERDPRPLLQAIAELLAAREISAATLELRLRATGDDALYGRMIEELGIGSVVKLAPELPYREALREMQSVSGLLVLQGSACNNQIPAKAYEYLRAGRPIVALTDPNGDTARLLRANGVRHIAPIDDVAAIRRAILEFVSTAPASPTVPAEGAVRLTRRARAGELAELLGSLTNRSAALCSAGSKP
jgi:glycosyltransferase involved in cell wall biosynthesis